MPPRKPTDALNVGTVVMRKHFAPSGLAAMDREKLISLVHKQTLNVGNNVSSVKNDKKNDKLQQ